MIPYYAIILFDEADAWNEAWEIRTLTGVVASTTRNRMDNRLMRPRPQ